MEPGKAAPLLDDPDQSSWLLFHKTHDDLEGPEILGLFFFDALCRLGYKPPRALFIVHKTYEWAYKEITDGRPAVVQLIDHRFLVFHGEPTGGYHAWDLDSMKEAHYSDLPGQPLISVAISLSKLCENMKVYTPKLSTSSDKSGPSSD